MKTTVTEIAPDVYRLSTFHPQYRMQFNQFLVNDEEPFMMHTGFKGMFPITLSGIKEVMDPAKLRWIGFSHFESDECGALNELLAIAPHAQAVCSAVGATVNLSDFAVRPARALADSETLRTGRRSLRFLATPHVPHSWDAGLFFEETDGTLLCSDLFFHPGDPEPVTESDVLPRAHKAVLAALKGPLANDLPYTPYTERTILRLAALQPKTLALMHGSSFKGDGGKALRGLAEVLKETLARPAAAP